MQSHIWKPKITNQEIYTKWQEVFSRLYPQGYILQTILKREPTNLDHYLIMGYSPNRQGYRQKYENMGYSSFDPDFSDTLLRIGKRYDPYSLAVNKYPYIMGASLAVIDEMAASDERSMIKDFITWSKIAREQKVRLVKNYPDNGASIIDCEHVHFFPFEVPLEAYLKHIEDCTMIDFPGKNLIFDYRDIDRLVARVIEIREQGTSPNVFMMEDKVGLVERTTSKDAKEYFAGANPSGGTILGFAEVHTPERFNELKKTSFKDDWSYVKMVLVPRI